MAWAFSASEITLKNIKHVTNMLKEAAILTKDVSLSCIDLQLWEKRNSLDRHLNILLSSIYPADIPNALYEMSSGGKKSIKI